MMEKMKQIMKNYSDIKISIYFIKLLKNKNFF